MMDLAGEMLQIQLFNALVHRECSTQSLRAKTVRGPTLSPVFLSEAIQVTVS